MLLLCYFIAESIVMYFLLDLSVFIIIDMSRFINRTVCIARINNLSVYDIIDICCLPTLNALSIIFILITLGQNNISFSIIIHNAQHVELLIIGHTHL